MSINMHHVTLKSIKMSNNDDKQSNCRLSNVLCLTKDYLLIVANLQSNNLFNFSTYSVANSHET